ncbi:helix-turn-helix domain-containing protein [Bizionia arctica]|uniref:Transcriptional regulator n=1 Tax=Bizionia arctica TaxID=1495645 RepID=A0A917GIA4_9FLAO|nr:helix-turn-helix domain-containing protein [Bizionia arctica]GGG46978.1 transcriptional regulator [Bizionia arctica]
MAQIEQNELDSLEQKLYGKSKPTTDSIILLGTRILSLSNSDEQKARILGKMAITYFEKNDLNRSTELFFEAKNMAEKSGNHELIVKIYGSLAHQYVHLKLKDKASYYLNKAIEEIEELPVGDKKDFLKGLSYLELGNLEYDNKNYLLAKENYKQSLKEFQNISTRDEKMNYHYRRSFYNIGNSFVYLNEPDSAKWYLENALQIQNDNVDLNFFIKNAMARVYKQKGLHQQAIDSLEIMLQDEAFTDIRLKSEMYQELSQNYKKLENNEQYYNYNEKFIKLRDSLQLSGLSAIDSAINTEQKEYILALSESDRTNKNLIIASLTFLILLTLTILYLANKKKKERLIFEDIIGNLNYKLHPLVEDEKKITIKGGGNNIPNPVEQDLLFKLEKFEKSGRFTNPKLTIATLAVQLKTNTSYLSEIINNHKEKNFNAYINELRIKYICEKIYTHPEYLNYKISYLAEESGFASHSSFSTVFKTVTGLSPSTFLRETNKTSSNTTKTELTS